jgi:predicted transcriptional regulator
LVILAPDGRRATQDWRDSRRIRMAVAAMADPESKPKDIARELGGTTTTLHEHVNGDGSPKAAAEALLRGSARP